MRILLSVLSVVLVYFAFWFVFLEPVPTHWADLVRILFCVCSLFAFIFVYFYPGWYMND